MEKRNNKKNWKKYFRAWRKVRHNPEIRDIDFRLLKEIEDCQGKDTHTWIAQETLAERLGKSRGYINKRIAFLRKKGFLRVLKKRHKRTLKLALKCNLQFTIYVIPRTQDSVNHRTHNHNPMTITQDRKAAITSRRKQGIVDNSLDVFINELMRERQRQGSKIKNREAYKQKLLEEYLPQYKEIKRLARKIEGIEELHNSERPRDWDKAYRKTATIEKQLGEYNPKLVKLVRQEICD